MDVSGDDLNKMLEDIDNGETKLTTNRCDSVEMVEDLVSVLSDNKGEPMDVDGDEKISGTSVVTEISIGEVSESAQENKSEVVSEVSKDPVKKVSEIVPEEASESENIQQDPEDPVEVISEEKPSADDPIEEKLPEKDPEETVIEEKPSEEVPESVKEDPVEEKIIEKDPVEETSAEVEEAVESFVDKICEDLDVAEMNQEEDPAGKDDKVEKTTEPAQASEAMDTTDTPTTTDVQEPSEMEVTTSDEPTQVTEDETQATEDNSKDETQPEVEPTKSDDNKSVDNPDDIINLLKSLSPEKLKQIKSKVLEIADDKQDAPSTSEETSEKAPEVTSENLQEVPQSVEEKKDDDVICLDSDEEQEGAKSLEAQQPPEKKQKTPDKEIVKKPKMKECINPNCPRNSHDEYFECPVFVMNLYYVTRKPTKIQWICASCYEKGIDIYEQLCTNLSNGIPWTDVKIPKKQDLVEILDSDDEDEPMAEKRAAIPEEEMFEFTPETEKLCEEILVNIASRVDLKYQLDNEFKIIEQKANKQDELIAKLNEDMKVIEKKSQDMYDALYAINRPRLERRPSLHIDKLPFNEPAKQIQVHGPRQQQVSTSAPVVQNSAIEANAFAVRPRIVTQANSSIPLWSPCKLLEEVTTPEGKKYKVQFFDTLPKPITIVPGKEFAYDKTSMDLNIGARVIARFPRTQAAKGRNNQQITTMRFLPGVIGEKLSNYNHRRYLVFCDYGQVKYCAPCDVRAVMSTSENVWEDVHRNLSQFIRDYLKNRNNETNRTRAMLNLAVGSKILVEQSSNWRQAVVNEIDCSLAKIVFPHNKATEWLYRGSKRLHPIYLQAAKSLNAGQRSARRDPGISYITVDDEEESNTEAAKKNIAKKSTAQQAQPEVQQQQAAAANQQQTPQNKVTILNDDQIYLEDPANVGKVRHFTPKQEIRPRLYVKHTCSRSCLPKQQNNLASFSPLAKPLLACWERQIVKQKNTRWVVYKAPCGRRCRNMREIFNYLRVTQSFLNVENFDLDPTTQVLATYRVQPELCGYYTDDCTEGKEGMKIPVINAFDNVQPPPLEYSEKRIPMEGVNINTDPEFMSCCDCTDDCVDKSKCACFQLTIQGAKYKNLMEGDDDDISYIWKRLLKNVPTGIYECNSRCKCSDRCLNKVVQKPIQVKLILFRTKKRGWGLKTVHDIPKGTFICIYAGNLYNEKDANALCHGQNHGDEYFAELDLIEVVESMKEGYEPGVINPDSEEENADSDSDYDEAKDKNDYDDGEYMSRAKTSGGREILTRSSKTNLGKNSRKNSNANSEDSDNDIPTINMIPSVNARIPLRKLFGPKERSYIMDAKKCGNVGRYFNHSCEPNLFVQNVFVDTHDLRFPWIAFFTSRQVKASEELTWNYQYEIGSVPSKVLYCHCGSSKCIGRIL